MIKNYSKKRVAAYARVSNMSSAHSFENQVTAYSAFIQCNKDWEFVDVYADIGITGRFTKKRDGFNRLIADCESGYIDLILTKSISRFARNTVDMLNTVRHLKDLGVEVYFEEQNLSTMTSEGELMLTLLAAYAQEESTNLSNNVKWAIRKGFEEGKPHRYNRILGYVCGENGYEIVPDEADVVREIYRLYLDGKSSVEISRMGFKSINGIDMNALAIRRTLKNPSYTGDLVLQKSYAYAPKVYKVNYGELAKYLVKDDHPAIISHEDFDKVQTILAEKYAKKTPPQRNKYAGRVKCGYCGHKMSKHHRGTPQERWECSCKQQKGIKDSKLMLDDSVKMVTVYAKEFVVERY